MYEWLPCEKSQPLDSTYSRAVRAGWARDDETSKSYPVYVGRCSLTQQPANIVAKISSRQVFCEEARIPHVDGVRVVDQLYEILVVMKGWKGKWKFLDSEERIPSQAVTVGESSNNQPLYSARILDFPFKGTTCVGKIRGDIFYYPHKDGKDRLLHISEHPVQVLTVVRQEWWENMWCC